MQLCAQRPAAVCAAFKDNKRSAAECTDQNCDFVASGKKHSSVDVTPTLGVNHVISGVVVLVIVSVSVYLSCINS